MLFKPPWKFEEKEWHFDSPILDVGGGCLYLITAICTTARTLPLISESLTASLTI